VFFLAIAANILANPMMAIETLGPSYFTGFLTGPGSLTHPPVVPVRISQMQAPLQCTVVLHAPLQTGSRLACVRSCRAETVPAQRTAAAIPVKIKFLIVLPIVLSHFYRTALAEKDA
jgi:hypothetical protein